MALLAGCGNGPKDKAKKQSEDPIAMKVKEFTTFKLTTDLSVLSEKEKQMLPYLFEAADIMNALYWMQAYGSKDELMNRLKTDDEKAFAMINYGPWERLNNNEPFVDGFDKKPKGAGFYPADMTVDEFEKLDDKEKTGLYTVIKRKSDGSLESVPYHVAYKKEVEKASELVRKAAGLAEDAGLKKYLELRAEALLNDDYFESDIAWMDMKTNNIDFIVGPIENYEDQLFGYKTAFESFILVKDKEWSKKLEKYAALLPQLQKDLPCPPKYKSEMPGTDSDLNAYDAIYYAGDCNAGSKTIAINLPNDEKVRETKGSRKLQLKNSMRAKFDKILVPISDVLIVPEQRKHVKFDAFFENVMFHEVAHGLGMGNTIDGKTTVRAALKDSYTSIEESKADILGLWAVTKLNEMGEFGDKDLMDNFVTFMAGIFRSVRFGAASAHGKANMIRFYYFQELGAFERDAETGLYKVDFDKMKQAMLKLSEEILIIQGDGNYDKASALIKNKGFIREELQNDLQRIASAGVPRDIVFEQGKSVIGL
jgi:hypothetical protein